MTTTLPSFDAMPGNAISAHDNPEGAVAATAALLKNERTAGMPTITEPGPVHLTLAQGVKENGVFMREAEVIELSGADEEALARCKGDFGKIVDTLVVRGTRTIGNQFMTKQLADQLLIGDRESLILAIRRATFGETVDFEELPCPHCGELIDLKFALDDIPVRTLENPDQTEFPVPLRHGATAFVRLPNGADQNAVQATVATTTVAEQNSMMLSRVLLRIEYPGGDVITASADAGKNMSMADRRTILDFLLTAQPGPQFDKSSFIHELCEKEVPMPMTLAILFRGL